MEEILMRIRVFGKINPIEDMYYSTTLHLTQSQDVELELDLNEIPEDDSWILYYDDYIGNILNLYKEIEKHLEKTLASKYRNRKRKLTNIVFSPCSYDFACWYFDYVDCDDYEHPMIVVTTDEEGNIIELEY